MNCLVCKKEGVWVFGVCHNCLCSNTKHTESNNLTVEKINEEMEKIPKAKRPIVHFTNIVPQIFTGTMVDKLLNCSEDEKGFLIPIKLKHKMYQYEASLGALPFRLFEEREIKKEP